MNRGYTLAELVIVTVVVSILLAVLVPPVCREICGAREQKARTLVRQIETVCVQYEKAHNVYPPGAGVGSAACYAVLSSPGPRW